MSFLFGFASVYWVVDLHFRKCQTSKIHYFMSVLAFTKFVSLLLHAFNYYYIGKQGETIDLWKYFFFSILLFKNQLFYLTIAVMYKKFNFIFFTFKIVLILQFMATFADILLQKLEPGNVTYSTWRDIFILSDLLSCVLILLPALSFGEKLSAENEDTVYKKKLKLLRKFYIVFICYVFLTRIIV